MASNGLVQMQITSVNLVRWVQFESWSRRSLTATR